MAKSLNYVLSGLMISSALAGSAWAGLPELPASQRYRRSDVQELVRDSLKGREIKGDKALVEERLTDYMLFLDIEPSTVGNSAFQKTLVRLLNSSTQFLLCDFEDFACLEKRPALKPRSLSRQDTSDNLGKMVKVNKPLVMEQYFTKRWAQRLDKVPLSEKGMADKLAEKLLQDGEEVSMALYGIDDTKNSMKPVSDAVTALVKSGKKVRGVFDVIKSNGANGFLRDYDVQIHGDKITVTDNVALTGGYALPSDPSRWIFGRPKWMDDLYAFGDKLRAKYQKPKDLTKALNEAVAGIESESIRLDVRWLTGVSAKDQDLVQKSKRMAWQYADTLEMLQSINKGIKNDKESRGRIEWKSNSIMHNKFFVTKNKDGKRAVWTGSTNVARTCMGEEKNSNVSVYLRDDNLAKVYLLEFEEMFGGNKAQLKEGIIYTGNYHGEKRPNTPRYFKYSDGTEARVHFSPTDDGEHRSLIPMLLSAKKGDHVRIAMFGAGGVEFVRALQFAAAKGAKIEIVFDQFSGRGDHSWSEPEDPKKFFDKTHVYSENPYGIQEAEMRERLQLRYNLWSGLNHHKSGSITDAEGRVKYFVVGSQNWSITGNDANDENMLSLRIANQASDAGLAAHAYNKEFDTNLWRLSAPLRELKAAREALGAEDAEDAEAEE